MSESRTCIKGRFTPFTRFCRFLLSRHKRNRRKKKTSLSRRAAFFASIFAPLSADCESSAYLVSAYGRCLNSFSLILHYLKCLAHFRDFWNQSYHLRFADGNGLCQVNTIIVQIIVITNRNRLRIISSHLDKKNPIKGIYVKYVLNTTAEIQWASTKPIAVITNSFQLILRHFKKLAIKNFILAKSIIVFKNLYLFY